MVYYWFRMGDMRLHDNPGLDRAHQLCSEMATSINNNIASGGGATLLVPVFCFDPRVFGDGARSEFGFLKCGPRRAKFVLESVADLRRNLQQQGSQLLVATERPEDFFAKLCKDIPTTNSLLVYQEEVASEEIAVAQKVQKYFSKIEAVWGSTLYDRQDLPYDTDTLHDMPDTFTPFRNMVEKKCTIRKPLAVPKQLSSFRVTHDSTNSWCDHLTYMPTLHDLGYTLQQIDEANTQDPRGVMTFEGGETAALARVNDYIWDKDLLRTYFDTRNGMIGADYSSKFSPWLAHGNLSPRFVADQCRKYEELRVANKSTYWLVFELLWRDFFKVRRYLLLP